jgi:hypothetical protein
VSKNPVTHVSGKEQHAIGVNHGSNVYVKYILYSRQNRSAYTREQCDDDYPQCSNCAKAGASCNRPPEWEGQSRSYTRALEDQVAYLETRLSTMEGQQRDRSESRTDEHNLDSIAGSGTLPVQVRTPSNSSSQSQHNVADVVGMLSLGRGNAQQSYIGSSSGYAMATDLGRMVQATIWNKALYVSADTAQAEVSPGENTSRRITIQELQSGQGELPTDALGKKLIHAYLGRIHPRFPFLFRSDVWEAHRCRYILQRDSHGHGNDNPSFSSPAYKQNGFALFVLNIVYAIGTFVH